MEKRRSKRGLDPEDFLRLQATTIDKVLCETANSVGRYATMIFVTIDLNTGKGKFLNAGHPPPYQFGKEKVTPLYRPNSLLGLDLPKAPFQLGSFSLRPGESLLLYTDGLVENVGPRGLLKPRKLKNYIKDAANPEDLHDKLVSYFHGASALEDDFTFLILTLGHRQANTGEAVS